MTTRLWLLIEAWLDAQMFRPTQSQLAGKLGVTRSAVSQWKHGQARPTPENLRDLADLTRIPYVDLRTAVIEDLGYLLDEEVGNDDTRSAANAQAGVSPAYSATETESEAASRSPEEATSPPPRQGRRRPGQPG